METVFVGLIEGANGDVFVSKQENAVVDWICQEITDRFPGQQFVQLGHQFRVGAAWEGGWYIGGTVVASYFIRSVEPFAVCGVD